MSARVQAEVRAALAELHPFWLPVADLCEHVARACRVSEATARREVESLVIGGEVEARLMANFGPRVLAVRLVEPSPTRDGRVNDASKTCQPTDADMSTTQLRRRSHRRLEGRNTR